MVQGEPWMYHAHISFYLNCGLLLPLECVGAAETAYHQGKAPLNAVEGFIRQMASSSLKCNSFGAIIGTEIIDTSERNCHVKIYPAKP